MDGDQDQLVKQWTNMFTSEVLEFANFNETSNEEVFADIYHAMAHSPLAATMIQLEHSNASALVGSNTEALDNEKGIESEYERVCRISNEFAIRETQRREFRQWIQTVHEDSSSSGDQGELATVASGTMSRSDSAFTMSSMTAGTSRSESFTITLGAQMKAMHNLRLVAADIFADICSYPHELEVALPQRLQTSMALYSNNLSGLVLLTDIDLAPDRLSHHGAEAGQISKKFSDICHSATEFHFPSFEQQLESIRNDYLEPAIAWRLDYISRNSFQHLDPSDPQPCPPPCDRLKPGDFFTTRHSNLNGVHVVFHMVNDTNTSDGNINSRHPVVMGLRHVLKVASMSSVSTLTVPLLLSHTMEENMTIGLVSHPPFTFIHWPLGSIYVNWFVFYSHWERFAFILGQVCIKPFWPILGLIFNMLVS